jgi:hypothetical protein
MSFHRVGRWARSVRASETLKEIGTPEKSL